MNKNRKMSVIYTGKEKCQVNGRQKDHENKKALKTALIELLDKQDFEHVSITELCRKADVSRITFYSHYNDKYALLDDIFEDMLSAGKADYYRRQKENNPRGHLVAGYVNMLDCILEIYFDRYDFFRHTDPEKNPYISSRFYSIVLETVELHTDHVRRRLQLKYSRKRLRDLYVLECLDLSTNAVWKIRLWNRSGKRRRSCLPIFSDQVC